MPPPGPTIPFGQPQTYLSGKARGGGIKVGQLKPVVVKEQAPEKGLALTDRLPQLGQVGAVGAVPGSAPNPGVRVKVGGAKSKRPHLLRLCLTLSNPLLDKGIKEHRLPACLRECA